MKIQVSMEASRRDSIQLRQTFEFGLFHAAGTRVGLLMLYCIFVTIQPLVAESGVVIASGKERDNVTWTLFDNGTMVLDGNGGTIDYSKNGDSPTIRDRPWNNLRPRIKKLVVCNGIDRIGHRAFQTCLNLEEVVLPHTVTNVGQWAFQHCHALSNVTLPTRLKLDGGAFGSTPVEGDILATESDAYVGSIYYKRLLQVESTGNYRDDVMAVARSQIGYHEGDGEADCGGGNLSSHRDYTEYGRHFGTAGAPWCSEFASWCIRMAGCPRTVANSSRCANAHRFCDRSHATCHPWSETIWGGGSYLPRKGDLVLLALGRMDDNGGDFDPGSTLSHTILLDGYCEDGDEIRFSIVNGNSGQRVRPEVLVVNKADGSKRGGRGRIGFFVAPAYEDKDVQKCIVKFNANGGTVDIPCKTVAIGGLYGALPLPRREGHVFSGWQNKVGRSVNMYSECCVSDLQTTSLNNGTTIDLVAQWSRPESSPTADSPHAGLRRIFIPSQGPHVREKGAIDEKRHPGAIMDAQMWTDARGRTVKATLMGVSENGKEAIFSKVGKSGLIAFPVDRLSSPDRERIDADNQPHYKRSDDKWVKVPEKRASAKSATAKPLTYGKTWETIPVEKTGIDPKVFDDIPGFIKSRNMGTSGLMIVVHGGVVYSYGNVKEATHIASCRKSILSMMYGSYVASGKIKLNETIKQLKIDDIGGLLPIEKTATVLDLITARSGVYHPSATAGGIPEGKEPPRGESTPGTRFVYNNWDFNVAGTVFEMKSHRSIYDEFDKCFAKPLKFQDWDRASHRRTGDSSKSIHLSYHFRLSVRDMAKLGELMLRKGKWNGKTIIPEKWVEESTRPFTRFNDSDSGYGYMWWIEPFGRRVPGAKGSYSACGNGGQYITVIPELDMVVAHKSSIKSTSGHDYRDLLRMICNGAIKTDATAY